MVTIAQEDDPELLEWLANAKEKAGGFVSNLAAAALVADWENYPILRPVLLLMREVSAVRAQRCGESRDRPEAEMKVAEKIKRLARVARAVHLPGLVMLLIAIVA